MIVNLVGPFVVNAPFGTEIAFRKGFEALGVETYCADPNISSDLSELHRTPDATLVFKSACGREEYLRNIGGLKIVYQPDDIRFPHIKEMVAQMRQYCEHFLSFDAEGCRVAKSMGYRTAEILALTADPDIYYPEDVEQDIDISFVGSLGDPVAHASRRRMVNIVASYAAEKNLKTCFLSGEFNVAKIRNVYNRSKIVLNHATDVGQEFGTGYGLQCRHFETAMCRSMLLSNTLLSSTGTSQLPFCSFYDDISLLNELAFLLKENAYREKLRCSAFDSTRSWHMPIHRAKSVVNFIMGERV